MRHIVVTRPQNQATALIEAILAQGDDPIACPLLTLSREPENSEVWRHLDDDLCRLDKLIVVSPTAASILQPFLSKTLSENPNLCLITPGLATAETLVGAGCTAPIRLDDIVYPTEETGSEAICRLEVCQKLTGQRIGIIGGPRSHARLTDTLTHRGGQLSYHCLYRREPAPPAQLPLETIGRLALANQLDTLIVTSSEAMGYLAELLDSAYDRLTADRLRETPLLTVHRRIEEIAHNCGFSTTMCVDAHHQAIVEALYNGRHCP